MAENSHIEWCTHTFNTHWGCTKVSDGCKNCYADTLDSRFGESHWGPKAGRKPMSEAYWAQLDKWQRKAEKGLTEEERHPRIFCNSMSDLMEGPETCQDRDAYRVVTEARARLFAAIERTPLLRYLLLTKRIGNVLDMVPAPWLTAGFPPNVWLGTSVEDQKAADERIPDLLRVPAAVRFLSVEPLLGPVDLTRIGDCVAWDGQGRVALDALAGGIWKERRGGGWTQRTPGPGVDWVIVGGESGPGARPMHPDWARAIRDQCQAADVPFLFKQHGEWLDGRDWDDYCAGTFRGETREVEQEANPNRCRIITLCRVGKKAAGRMLDGRTWDEYPQIEYPLTRETANA